MFYRNRAGQESQDESPLRQALESEERLEQVAEDPPYARSWLEVMLAGQLTRDPVLRTRCERRGDAKRARYLDRRRSGGAPRC
ncbi:MAG: hypothetical protein KDI09_05320 [Halioglobus sp.]|nr:hypothetical protein [Halioglobus sp.]